jgi:hypothetical protein
MTDSPTPPPNTPVQRAAKSKRAVTGLLAFLTACWAILMFMSLRPYKFAHDFYDEIDSPVLAVELAPSAQALQAVLRTSNPTDEQCARRVLKINNRFDLVFIPIYASFLWFFADLVSVRGIGTSRYLRLICFVCVVAAAVFDYLEDWGISRILTSTLLTDSVARATRVPSLFKWGLIGITLFLTSIILLREAPVVYSLATTRLLSVLYGGSGLLIIFGLVRHPFLESGMKIFGFLVVLNAIGLLGPIVQHRFPGVEPTYIPDFCERRQLALESTSTAIKAHRLTPPDEDLPQSR